MLHMCDFLHNICDLICPHALVDHIFFSRSIKMNQHAWGPVTYSSPQQALSHLVPSLEMPSDHLPLVAEVVLSSCGLGERVAESVARAVAGAAGLVVGVVALGIFGMIFVASALRGTALERFVNDTGEILDEVTRGSGRALARTVSI